MKSDFSKGSSVYIHSFMFASSTGLRNLFGIFLCQSSNLQIFVMLNLAAAAPSIRNIRVNNAIFGRNSTRTIREECEIEEDSIYNECIFNLGREQGEDASQMQTFL